MKKILIVDDSAFSRNIIKQIVTSESYLAIEAGNGTEALTLFQAEKPDIVTIDLLMPDMDGIDVVRKIAETAPGAKMIVCSTDKQKFRQKETKAAGAAAFVPKPIDPELLLETIKNLLET
jgi:two-component system chemotaxis response regulator CheY